MITDINNVPIEQAIKENGFVIVDNLIPQDMFIRLKEACDRVVNRARKGDWKYRRLVGTQFPPWTEGTDVWGVQHMIHPDLKEPVFAEWYGSPKLLEAVQQLLNTKHDDLQLELFNLLINPQDSDFDLTWHRDAIKAEASEEEEKEKLTIPHYGTQWNTALYDDACLYVVPNSHRRVRTEAERDITIHDPKSNKMPGQLKVELKPGQTVFYDNNILHRASYVSSQKRATLHASMGTIEGGHYRASCILQHGLGWMKTEEFRSTLPKSLDKPYANLLAMANKAGMSDLEAKPIH
ncbi:uncharacterized protein B0P05DRAFT_469482 [Gilbertella persicaria]|uniref:Nicotinamide N-methyltransferase n=1 Tax=Rhizopus stolonifer TaxID=4846 RepID=A0A367JKY1_RHIST|nr:uncharacterized protein B0P05DRAFT_469482 [Gilbertella persicaria]KAI8080276.1 hypothetical protein B0P05DRAFT_469482 [Gilbertella persicaria]RCH90588.1 hypothetical protein CU098_005185 [Rhizopus stolonifer]